MAPEALKGNKLEPSTDIYSLGVSMWQLLYRQLPYNWIKNNEVVAYQVVKYNLRPDSKKTTSNISKLKSSSNFDYHTDCLCKHYSSEIFYRSVKDIKTMVSSDGHNPQKNLFLRTQLPIPHKELSPLRRKARKNLKNEFCGVGSPNVFVERNSSSTLDKQKLKIIFSPDAIEDSLKELIKDSLKSLYVSCWDKDQRKRPDGSEVLTKLKLQLKILNE